MTNKPENEMTGFAAFLQSAARLCKFLESCGIHNCDELDERVRQVTRPARDGGK